MVPNRCQIRHRYATRVSQYATPMSKQPTIRFAIRKQKPCGEGHLATEMHIFGKRTVRHLGITINARCWDHDAQRAIHVKGLITAREVASINERLEAERLAFQRLRADARAAGRDITTSMVRASMDGAARAKCFLEVFGKQSHRFEESGRIKAPTLKAYLGTLTFLSEWRDYIPMSSLDKQFPHDLEEHMHRCGLAVSTRAKHHKHVKAILTEIREDYAITDIYAKFRVRRAESNPIVLTIEEVRKLQRLHDERTLHDSLQRSLSMFLFACGTGLRYSDLQTVTHDAIANGWLNYYPVKTERTTRMVRFPIPPDIIRYAHSNKGRLFQPITNACYNKHLKSIAIYAGIRKRIHAHTARHTFATTYISRGGQAELLMRLLGHSKIDHTMIYVRIAGARIAEERPFIEGLYAREDTQPTDMHSRHAHR